MGNTTDDTSNTTEPVAASQAVALLLCTDLMFGVQLQNMAKHSGLKPVTVRPGSPLPVGDILVVDLGTRGDWESMVREASSRGMKVVAFGPHMDAESRTKAKVAGASRVLANSNLARDLPIILKEINHA
ncbi:MAG: hypothetical protein ABIQ44_08515 [Chloroflexia bacterium]